MNKFLIFRTDRIGDFLISTPIISSLKRNYSNCKIDIICSKSNYDYIKSFDIFNKVLVYPDNFFKKIFFYFSLDKYDHILVLDGKKRSIYISIFKISKSKTLFTPSILIKNLYKIFFNNVFFINYDIPKINIIKKYLLEINCDYKSTDINFLLNYENSNVLKYNIIDKNYILLNFDEKWIFKNYLKTYKNIEPTFEEFENFISLLSKNRKIIITNGFVQNPLIDELKIKLNNNPNDNLIIKDKISIFELQYLIKNCTCLISCHGAPSHIASNYNIKIIDIIDITEIKFFESYNHHFNNKIQIIRENFANLSEKIISSV